MFTFSTRGRQDVVGRHNLILLVVEHGIPADFAVTIGDARGDALSGELYADGIVIGHGMDAEVWKIQLRELDKKMGGEILEESAQLVVATMPVE